MDVVFDYFFRFRFLLYWSLAPFPCLLVFSSLWSRVCNSVEEVWASTELAAPLRRVLGELGEGGAAGLVAVQGSGCWAAAVGRGCVNVNVNVNVMSCRYRYRYRYQYRVSSHREMGRKGWSSLCGEVARLSARRDLVPGRWLCRGGSAR